MATAKRQTGIDKSRRRLIQAAAAVPMAAAFGSLGALVTHASGRTIRAHDPRLVPSRDTLWGWLQQLHQFGPVRNTGTAACRAFEEWLASRFGELGCAVERDQFRLMSWEGNITDCHVSIREDSGATRELDVVAYYPFSKSTRGGDAAVGRLIFAGLGDEAGEAMARSQPDSTLAESIVVINMPIRGHEADGKLKTYPGTFPAQLPPLTSSPNAAAGIQSGLRAMAALEHKCRGLLLCYSDVDEESVRHNFLPFTDRHRAIPALWVGRKDSDYLERMSGKATATLRLDAVTTPDARADTLLATMKGNSNDVVVLTTQTDGPNECNENGALGVLAAATYLSKLESRRKTYVFSLPTGHYAGGPVSDNVTGSGRRAGTRGVMEKWPDVFKRTVAQIQLEQMAASEWAVVDGKWQATGRPAQEHWIPTPSVAQTMNRLFIASTEGENSKFSRADLVESGFPGGEGGALRGANIPGIGLMGWPHYFFRADPKGVIDKLSPDVMHNQVSIVTKLLTLMDRLSPDQLKGSAPIGEGDIFA